MLDFVQEVAYSSQGQSSASQIDLTACATISLAQAAQVLGIHRSTAWDLYRRGEFPIPVLKIGNRLRVTKAHLEDFLQSGVPQSVALYDS
jgi:excisionase family DNA binding protein